MDFIEIVKLFALSLFTSLVAGAGLYYTAKLVVFGFEQYEYGEYDEWATLAFYVTALTGYLLIILIPHGWHYFQLMGVDPVVTTSGFIDALDTRIDEKNLVSVIEIKAWCAPVGFFAGALTWRHLKS